ncbi:MAG: hypothetical protein GX649_12775 [Chloroflexi bacterium]|nr:hypothetical protein [Chloroflexota bacterium]
MRGNAEHSLVGWEPAGWGFWLRWTLISAIGFALSFIVAAILGTLWGVFLTLFGANPNVGLALGALLLGLGVGAVIGLLQWFVLHRYLSRSGWWIAASAVGAGLGFAVALVVSGAANGWLLGGIVGGLVGGALIGFLQWRVLRDALAQGASYIWIGASAVAWALAMALIGIGMDSVARGTATMRPGIILVALLGLVGMIIASAITGAVLLWLLRHPASRPQ